jgi:tetratricopeptide (TPR) repeat protein
MVTHRILLASAMAMALALPAGLGWAAGSDNSSSSGGGSSSSVDEYKQAQAKIKAEKYEAAIDILEEIVEDKPNNADAWNLMGYSHRKLGKFDEALKYYQKALSIKPSHIGANEYLGELYLEMKDLPKAEERLAVLARACNGCEEQKELEEKIAEFKANNS